MSTPPSNQELREALDIARAKHDASGISNYPDMIDAALRAVLDTMDRRELYVIETGGTRSLTTTYNMEIREAIARVTVTPPVRAS